MGRQARVFGVAVVALLALLAVFAVQLINSQSTARRDVEDRFRDRAKAGAALTESLFGSAASTAQADNAKRYGTARVPPQTRFRTSSGPASPPRPSPTRRRSRPATDGECSSAESTPS
jgi:type II secretory pathway component PulK